MSWLDDILGFSPSRAPGNPLAGTTPSPTDTLNHGYLGTTGADKGNTDALASIQSDDLLNHILARQAAGLRPLPDYSSAAQTLPTDQFWAGVRPSPSSVFNDGYPGTAGADKGGNDALDSIQNDDLLNHIIARQAAGLRPLPDYSSAPQTLRPDKLWAGVQPALFTPQNYPSALINPPNDAGLNPLDGWQRRGRDTAAMALSILYPQNGPMPVAANQPPNAGGGFQPFPPGPIGAGVQPIVLSTTGGAPRNAPGQVQPARALSQMRTDPAWQQDMKNRPNEDFVPWMYDATHKGDYTIGYGHKIASQPEFSDYLGKTISRGEGEALYQRDLATAEDVVRRNVIQPLTQNQFDALVDFAFQAGEGNFTKSDIYTYANLGDYPAAQRSFANTNAGTIGAYNRRVREAKKFGAP